jgi:hypothetical protein
VSPAEIVARAAELGVNLEPLTGNRLHYRGPASAIAALHPEFTTKKAAIIALLADRDRIGREEALLREGRFDPLPPSECGFFIGYASDPRCRRCGASWREHYPEHPDA